VNRSLALAAIWDSNRKRAPKVDDGFPISRFLDFSIFPNPLACARSHKKVNVQSRQDDS
jgi:hypothetical protein